MADDKKLNLEDLENVAGGAILYNADGSNIDGVKKYKVAGIMKTGQYLNMYFDDIEEAKSFARATGIDSTLIELE